MARDYRWEAAQTAYSVIDAARRGGNGEFTLDEIEHHIKGLQDRHEPRAVVHVAMHLANEVVRLFEISKLDLEQYIDQRRRTMLEVEHEHRDEDDGS